MASKGGKMKTDTELQHAVMEELAWEPSVDAAEIGVAAESGIVTLSGIVKSLPQKWAAEKAAQRVSGVKAVTDEIAVKLPGDSELSDTDIARAAVNALDWNASLPRGRVTLVVSHGWITLEGTVQFHYERVAAEYAVRGLTGVKGVMNLISVKPPQASPRDIKHRIEQAFERAADLDAQTISIDARDGKIVLRGTVDSWAERERAELAAWAAPGVSRVENEILVTSDQEIVTSL
jgi:osmotically-inducible protein OsmY